MIEQNQRGYLKYPGVNGLINKFKEAYKNEVKIIKI